MENPVEDRTGRVGNGIRASDELRQRLGRRFLPSHFLSISILTLYNSGQEVVSLKSGGYSFLSGIPSWCNRCNRLFDMGISTWPFSISVFGPELWVWRTWVRLARRWVYGGQGDPFGLLGYDYRWLKLEKSKSAAPNGLPKFAKFNFNVYKHIPIC